MRLRLATKISATIAGVVVLSVASSALALLAAWQVGQRFAETVADNVPSVRAAEELQVALLEQKGLIASYLLDQGNPAWLEQYRRLEPRFRDLLAFIRNKTHVSDEESALLGRLEATYAELDARRREAIALYQQGDIEQSRSRLLTVVNDRLYENTYDLCEQLIDATNRDVGDLTARASAQIRQVGWIVGISVALTIGLGAVLLWLFFYGVLFPLRGMVADARLSRGSPPAGEAGSAEDELRAVADYLRSLMSDVADTRAHLERSRSRLLSAEKLASVGKLAASVAHEIRNPLTAMKMWLFSIQEGIKGNSDLERKLRVVSEEITRLESIIRNFLEFSRPPALRRQALNVGMVIDQTLELLGPRLSRGRIRVVRSTAAHLPPVLADAEQLKQVLINLLDNAAEAMCEEGEIRISAAAERDVDGRPMVVVRLQDTGPGMPEELQRRIFEPFFTTKEDGTGLGLCIAAQIMARHRGLLVLESSSKQGTTFAVWAPIAPRESHGQDSCS